MKKVRNESAPAYQAGTAQQSNEALCAQVGVDLSAYASLADALKNDPFLSAAHTLVERALAESIRLTDAITSSAIVKAYLRTHLRTRNNEVFVCLYLDNQNRVIASEDLFFGTIDGCSVHPRVVVADAIKHNAAAVIFAHNHPSGVAEPSQADIQITKRLKNALALVDIRVLDHFIVGEEIVSLAERGLV